MPTTRLAPSPTGALHLGNARTFLITWAMARKRGWRIVLRIEDLDGPRVKPGAAEACIDTLRWLGLDWDEGPTVQSADLAPYEEAMRRLASAGVVYPSDVTRSRLAAEDEGAAAPQEGAQEAVYPAALRPTQFPKVFDESARAWRFATPDEEVAFHDEIAGPQRRRPAESVGDFLVWTKRGQPAYQLAVVVDDARQGITHVVRGDDLLDSAARQMLLIGALGIGPPPAYAHLPLVRGADGKRLAKRHGDTRLETYRSLGVGPERVIGLLAGWSGVASPRREMPALEFMSGFDPATLPRRDVVFTAEDHAWLLDGR